MAHHPFRVPVSTLLRHPGESQREVRRGRIPDLAVIATWVPAGSEVAVDVLLESVHGGILATGTVGADWVGECRRCLAKAQGRVDATVRELFETGPESDDSYPLHGDQLDLEPLARDAVALELPLAPLCSEGCRGLCAQCGADLNTAECSCAAVVRDPRWADLDVLREDRAQGH